jgi:hypothetical protein
MRRILCDGCWAAGIETDLTDLPPSKKWRVQVTRAKVLDLCTDRCAPIYQGFNDEKEKLMATHTEDFKQRLHEITDRFWREVSDGKEKQRAESGSQ